MKNIVQCGGWEIPRQTVKHPETEFSIYDKCLCLLFVLALSLHLCSLCPCSFKQVLQPSFHTLSFLPQFARAAVCRQQVIVAPHNSSYRKRRRERNLKYLMPTNPVGQNWLRENFLLNNFHFQTSNTFPLICS